MFVPLDGIKSTSENIHRAELDNRAIDNALNDLRSV
jgi:hypothetical protein